MLTPLLVAGMSLAAKRFGPTFGGLIMGLPWMTGPILYFLTLDKGAPFAANAAVGILLAVVAIASYMLAYAWASRVWPPTRTLADVSAIVPMPGPPVEPTVAAPPSMPPQMQPSMQPSMQPESAMQPNVSSPMPPPPPGAPGGEATGTI